jgi:hypothetical protein
MPSMSSGGPNRTVVGQFEAGRDLQTQPGPREYTRASSSLALPLVIENAPEPEVGSLP